MQILEESMFLSDKSGGYFVLGKSSLSQYQGLFHFLESEWELYKTIDDIKPMGVKPSTKSSIILQDGFFERHTEHVIERFFYSKKNLIYEIHGSNEIELFLDFREIHNYDDKGRIYKITQEKNNLIIEFTKFVNNDLKEVSQNKFLVIKGVSSFNLINQWVEKNYEYDSLRGTRSNFYVYDACKIIIQDTRLSFGFADTLKRAKKNANQRLEIKIKNLILNTEIAQEALENLHVSFSYKGKKVSGIFAGYPWFYQFWGRDEAISLIGFIKTNPKIAKEIIMRMVDSLDENGALANRWPKSGLGSADSSGWLYKRIYQMIDVSKKEKIIFSKRELRKIHQKVLAYANHSKSLLKDGLIVNGPLETWMDTADREGRDVREGARIEIQALNISAYSLGEKLSHLLKINGDNFTQLKKDLIENIRNKFLKNSIVVDGVHNSEQDDTIRPNIFLAYYVCPELFSFDEWILTFNKTINACYLDWGGFSSIDRNNYLFRSEHTGMNNESYHRGDSWFFVNNIAASCMYHLDKTQYDKYIKQIRNASVNEMMHMGFIGACAEISSAKELSSRGALAQAWSAATLIELLSEFHKQ